MEEIIFPNQIRMHRRLRGMSMQELADHLGVSLSAISKIEKGYRRLNQEQLIQVAELTDCTLQDLYVNEQNSQQDVIQAWRREQERRSKINENAGLISLICGLTSSLTGCGVLTELTAGTALLFCSVVFGKVKDLFCDANIMSFIILAIADCDSVIERVMVSVKVLISSL